MFEPINFITNLKYMGVGMLGVFLIVGIIIAATYIIRAVTDKITKNKANKEDEE